MPGPLAEASHFKTITVKELHPSYGAEIIGADFENATDEQFQEIKSAMAKVLPSKELNTMHF
jgi:alpha-ketoglutarate-dependent 2,4-dichlorophenoxyacetate dioxygenase